MRTESMIRADIASARADYHAAANTESAPQLAARSARLRELNDELLVALRGAAVACAVCGDLPHAHLKTPEYETRGQIIPAVYEVGCITCKATPESVPDRPEVVKMVYAATRAGSSDAAVAAWNRGERFSKLVPLGTLTPE